MKRFASEYIFTLCEESPIRNGFVEVSDDGVILRTGVSDDIDLEPNFYKGAIVPGFVNSHCHIELSSMWKLFRKGTGMAGFIDQINNLRDTKSKEEKIADIEHWMEVLWKRGVSAMADISNCEDSFSIKSKSKIYTITFLEVFGTEPEDCDNIMYGVKKLAEKAAFYGLDAAPTPHACYTMSPELLSASSDAGLDSGFLSFHSEETDEEEQMLIYGSGKMYENRKSAGMSTPPVTGHSSLLYFIDRLKAVRKPPFNENILLVHEVCMNQEGIDAVKQNMNNPFIALCPLSNLYIHNALPPVELMRSNGLKLTIGTDSLSSNDDLNMVSEMFCLQKNFPGLNLNELLKWACINGAEFLKKENIYGSIKEGKKPGLVFIDNIDNNCRLTASSTSSRII